MPEEKVVAATKSADVDTATKTVDYKARLDELMTKIDPIMEKVDKLEKERDSYKAGMLAKDRKLKELKEQGAYTDEAPTLTEERLNQILDEKLSALKPVEDLSVKRELDELKTALSHRTGIATAASGNSTESETVKAHRWVDEPKMKAELLAKGLNPDVVYKNWLERSEV